MPDHFVSVLLMLFAVIVFAEGGNKLERAAPLQPGLSVRDRLAVLMKVAAWISMVFGAAGVFIRPLIVVPVLQPHTLGAFLASDRSSLLFILGGFALLIVRSRFKEHRHA